MQRRELTVRARTGNGNTKTADPKKTEKKIAVIRVQHDIAARPVATEFWDGQKGASWAGDKCIDKLVEYLKKLDGQWIVYCHRGSHGAFFHLLAHLDRASIVIFEGGIVRAHMGRKKQLRDSWMILPFAIDDIHEQYRMIQFFREQFGTVLTVGAAAIKAMESFHELKRGSASYDAALRKFFFGGRNEAYFTGVLDAEINLYDVNQMYPFAMAQFSHPTGNSVEIGTTIKPNTFFLTVRGENYGAFPVRNLDRYGELDFDHPYGDFHVSIHEFEAALETGMFRPDKILEAYSWNEFSKLDNFAYHFHELRARAKSLGDLNVAALYKRINNSGFGKLAQNPEKFSDYYLSEYGEWPEAKGDWSLYLNNRIGDGYTIWSKPASYPLRYNIATAASITGAARAVLMKGLNVTDGPLYTDTDSIICSHAPCLPMDDRKIGNWRNEVSGARIAIVRKKVYAIFGKDGACLKKASAGFDLTPTEIRRAAEGEVIKRVERNPTFKLDGGFYYRRHEVRKSISEIRA